MTGQRATFRAHADLQTSTVRTRGELDLDSIDLFSDAIDLLVHAGCLTITVDLAGLIAIDAAGTRLLAALQHSLSTHSGDLELINAASAVYQALTQAQVVVRAQTDEQPV